MKKIKYVLAVLFIIAFATSVIGAGYSNKPIISVWQQIVAMFGGGSCSGYLKSDGTCSTAATSITGSANITTGTANLDTLTVANADINGGTIDGVNIGTNTPGTGKFTTLEATTGITNTNITVNDFVNMSVDWGMDSAMNSPDAAIKAQGNVGSALASNGQNVDYVTFTIAGANISAAVSGAAANATYTIPGLTAGKMYHWQFTPTLTSGNVPVVTSTSGISVVSTIPTLSNATVTNIYFRASAANAVFGIATAGAANFAINSSTSYEYTRPAIVREFSNSIQQTLVFDWLPPYDWNSGTITITPYMVVTNATAPANTETVIWQFAGYCYGDSDSLSQALGTAVNSTYVAGNALVQYDEAIGTETAAITLPGAGAGKKCRITADRLTSGSYAQKIGLSGTRVKFTRVEN
jgi:hypothetical protein